MLLKGKILGEVFSYQGIDVLSDDFISKFKNIYPKKILNPGFSAFFQGFAAKRDCFLQIISKFALKLPQYVPRS